MLNLSPWRHLPLVVHFFNDSHKRDVLENAKKKNVKIPSHVRVESGEMSVLDAYVKECNPPKKSRKRRRNDDEHGEQSDDGEGGEDGEGGGGGDCSEDGG